VSTPAPEEHHPVFADSSRQLPSELEAYYDAVPRSAARVEQIGPFTLFINPGPGWQYYARPSLGARVFTAADLHRVRARQRELGIPETFEWVAETTLALTVAAEAAGLAVTQHPLMVLRQHPAPPGCGRPPADGVEVRLATGQDDLALLNALARVAFAAPGTAVGSAGLADAQAVVERDPGALAFQQQRLGAGTTVLAVGLVAGQPVGIGSHQPVGSVTEVVGVAVLPAFRRRGIAVALTRWLVDDALERGVQTVFLSAGDATIGRVYERVGFRRIGSACTAEPVPPSAAG